MERSEREEVVGSNIRMRAFTLDYHEKRFIFHNRNEEDKPIELYEVGVKAIVQLIPIFRKLAEYEQLSMNGDLEKQASAHPGAIVDYEKPKLVDRVLAEFTLAAWDKNKFKIKLVLNAYKTNSTISLLKYVRDEDDYSMYWICKGGIFFNPEDDIKMIDQFVKRHKSGAGGFQKPYHQQVQYVRAEPQWKQQTSHPEGQPYQEEQSNYKKMKFQVE